MNILAWFAHFETGIAEIDEQHKYLFDLINRVAPRLALSRDEPPEDAAELFDEFFYYATEHFANEERLMNLVSVDPRHVAHHMQSHQYFIKQSSDMASAYFESEDVSGQKLLTFATNWLIFHIMGEDQTMARQILAIQSGLSPSAALESAQETNANLAQQTLTHSLVDLYTLLTEKNQELARYRDQLEIEVTDRVRDLQQISVKYKTVADSAYDWETWIDPAGRYVYCSPSCVRITGRSADKFMSDSNLLLDITHFDDKELVSSHLNSNHKDEGPCELSFRILDPDGRIRWLEHACQPVYDGTGRFLGRRASNRDITERKEMERQLEQAKNATETACESKNSLLVHMSHEIRSSMSAMLGMCDLLRRDGLTPKQTERLDKIDAAGEQLLGIIKSSIDFSMVEPDRAADKLTQSAEAAGLSTAATQNIDTVIKERYAGELILVVDDEPITREVAQTLLEAAGLIVDTAEDGEEAIELAGESAYAVILMDMQMPNVDGLEATRKIREMSGNKDTPIIAITANVLAVDKASCLAAGMSDFIAKPFNPKTLFGTVLRWLEHTGG